MDPVLSAVLLGFVLGLQHATDPDHVVAVATIVTRERRFSRGAVIGLLWGLGHTLTLTLVGGGILLLGIELAPAVGTGLELVVAAMLIVLGVLRLRDAARGVHTVAPAHLVADHDHGGGEAFHSHGHEHGESSHRHPHVHPSRRLLEVLARGRRGVSSRATLVGAVHGMAGSAAVSLLVIPTLASTTAGVAYLLVFGLGTIAGMTLLTAVLAYPVSVAARWHRARRALAIAAGIGSIAFGLAYAVHVV